MPPTSTREPPLWLNKTNPFAISEAWMSRLSVRYRDSIILARTECLGELGRSGLPRGAVTSHPPLFSIVCGVPPDEFVVRSRAIIRTVGAYLAETY
jgi:hypothetical protein